jgi:nitric oxide reductase activation protein
MSDGFPTFESSGFIYKGKSAILDTTKAVNNIKKKGVKVLSYFIETETNNIKLGELIKDFRIMYGKSASFIDSKNVYQITKTLNNLFLKRDLVL